MKTMMPATKCVVCQKKPARIGKSQGGYEHNLLCSAKCAVRHFLEQSMDFVFCDNCNQWMQCCSCPEEEEENQKDAFWVSRWKGIEEEE